MMSDDLKIPYTQKLQKKKEKKEELHIMLPIDTTLCEF